MKLTVLCGLSFVLSGAAATVPAGICGALNGPSIASRSNIHNGVLVFVGTDAGGQSQIFTICPDGSNQKQLTQTDNGNSYPAWSRDGFKIAWTSNQTGEPEIWTMNADGSGQTRLTFPPGSGNTVPSWSPAGDRIAFASVRTGHPEIWVMNADGSSPQQLTSTATPGGSNAPNWSPDGSRIAFASDSSGSPQVCVMNPDGSGLVQLTAPILPDFPSSNVPVWSPDGKRIAFWSGIEAQYGQVWVMEADGSKRMPLTNCVAPANCDDPAWSPDQTAILFDTNRSGPPETWIMNADGSGQTALLPIAYGAGRLPWQPVVLPRDAADRQIVFMIPTEPGVPPLAPGPGSSYEVAVMNLDGSGFRQLTSDGTFKFLPHFSPDGTKILYTKYSAGQYSSPNAVSDIAVYDLSSGTETMITHDGQDSWATWSPDGSRIAYQNATPPTAIWTVDPDGSNPHKVGSASGTAEDLKWADTAWSRDNWILFVVAQNLNGCFIVRVDKMRPDGSSRTQMSDGGANCSVAGIEPSGDADPGWSADSQTIYSSRGFPIPPANGPPDATERKLYSFSSDAWYPGKPETDLSLPSEPSCIEGVPKASPDGRYVLLFRACFDTVTPTSGIYLTDTAGTYRTFISAGFGPDWAPMHSERHPVRPE